MADNSLSLYDGNLAKNISSLIRLNWFFLS